MKSKRALMGYAAILILIFHLYIPVTSSAPETFLYRSSYIGVDLFFLLSGCSLGKREDMEYGSFLKNRFISVYIPFMVLAVINAVYKGRSIIKLLYNIIGIEFLQKGGGAFLWYVSGIMLIYLFTPLFIKLKKRHGLWSFAYLLAGWAVTAAVLQYGFGYTTVFILLNRIPVYLIGLYYDRLPKYRGKGRLALLLVLLTAGSLLVYRFGTLQRLNVPFKDMFYVIAIPMVLGIAELFEYVTEKTEIRFHILEWIGTFTLELYGLQMILAFDLEVYLSRKMGSGMPVFLITSLITILTAYAYHMLYGKAYKTIKDGGKEK